MEELSIVFDNYQSILKVLGRKMETIKLSMIVNAKIASLQPVQSVV